jgi:hypothetical protein
MTTGNWTNPVCKLASGKPQDWIKQADLFSLKTVQQAVAFEKLPAARTHVVVFNLSFTPVLDASR